MRAPYRLQLAVAMPSAPGCGVPAGRSDPVPAAAEAQRRLRGVGAAMHNRPAFCYNAQVAAFCERGLPAATLASFASNPIIDF